jgi:hypothetical protein
MNVGNSVRKAIDDWQQGEPEAAMLHACNAIDGTASKVYPAVTGSNARFTRLLRDNYSILGPMGIPGINIVDTRFPVQVQKPKALGGTPDLADVIYGIHRCTHGHGEELPNGFALIPDAAGPAGHTRMSFADGKAQLSDRIFGLLAVAVFSPANMDQKVPDGYILTFANTVMPINEWWGRAADFTTLAASVKLPNVTMDFKDWVR